MHTPPCCVLGLALIALPFLNACGETPPPPADDETRGLPVIELTGGPAFPLDAHLEAETIAAGAMSFDELFEAGDHLFHTPYNSLDGVGVGHLPDGTPVPRFRPFPPGGGAGAAISSQSCGSCHRRTASGLAHTNVAGDPGSDGEPPFNVRSTTSLFGDGMVQLVAQEITEDLLAIREEAERAARETPGDQVERALSSKGIDYGVIRVAADQDGELTIDLSGRRGIDPDLVVRPFGWKGNIPTLRVNSVGAAAGLMGMQAEEMVWRAGGEDAGDDPDGDGVTRELSVGDVTALVVYGAAQEIPQPLERLAELGYVEAPSAEDAAAIARGSVAFEQVGCSSCHLPELHLRNTVFEEPTLRGNGNYYSPALAERDTGYDLERAFRFDLLEVAEEPRAEPHPDGGALLRPYSDFRRHHMCRLLADPGGPQPAIVATPGPLRIDGEVVLIAATEFLTPELWGVGNTGPWLHDGRATTLAEAVLAHGEEEPLPPGDPGRSEAQESRESFTQLPEAEREALLIFLRSLRTFIVRGD